MKIPFHKPHITDEEINEVVSTLRTGWITMGPRTIQFEEEFAQYLGARHAVAVNSGTAALHLALRVIDLKAGDEVIVPATTFTATAEVVCYFDANPIIVDVDRDTHNMDVKSAEKAITSRTRAIVPVHFAGQPCHMDEIINLAREHGLVVIEDAAHAVPAKYRGRMIGTIGDLTCFSFYSTKPIATGEGGIITTYNDAWAERLRRLRLHGITKDAWKRYTNEGSWYYEVLEPGFKYNMTDIQAALGVVQLRKADWMLERRKEIARRYTEAFRSLEQIIPPFVYPDRESAWHLYVIKLRLETLRIDRADFIQKLRERGIETSVHFIPLYRHPFYRDRFHLKEDDFPNAEWIYERSISIPIYPGMTGGEIEYVIDNITEICKTWKR